MKTQAVGAADVAPCGVMDVLVVEDDPGIAEPLVTGLTRAGMQVRHVATAADALAAPAVDVVVLDLGLPDGDGTDVCRVLRSRGDVAIIVCSARGEELDRILLLELGADDYLVKPFGVRELVARIRAVVRRTQRPPVGGSVAGSADAPADGRGAGSTASPDGSASGAAATTTVGGVTVDERSHRVWVRGVEVDLTPKEYDLLALLLSEPGRLFRRVEILERVWDEHWYGPTKTLDVHLASLRRKLDGAVTITTVRGVGFRVDA